jgi:hypothetical protein
VNDITVESAKFQASRVNSPSRVIKNAHLEEKTTAPDAESTDGVGERQPEWHEKHPGEKVHTAEVGSGRNDEGDCSEDKLEINHGGLREILVQIGRREIRLGQFILHCQCRSRNTFD